MHLRRVSASRAAFNARVRRCVKIPVEMIVHLYVPVGRVVSASYCSATACMWDRARAGRNLAGGATFLGPLLSNQRWDLRREQPLVRATCRSASALRNLVKVGEAEVHDRGEARVLGLCAAAMVL